MTMTLTQYNERVEEMFFKLAKYKDVRISELSQIYDECYTPDTKLGLACFDDKYLKNKLLSLYNQLCLIYDDLNN